MARKSDGQSGSLHARKLTHGYLFVFRGECVHLLRSSGWKKKKMRKRRRRRNYLNNRVTGEKFIRAASTKCFFQEGRGKNDMITEGR